MRSFSNFDDLIDEMVEMIEIADHITGSFNIGNFGEISMLELEELALKLTGSKSKLIFLSSPQDDPQHRPSDIDAARGMLGWEPKVTLEGGLKETAAYFKLMQSGQDKIYPAAVCCQ